METLLAVDWKALLVPTNSLVELFIRGTTMYFVLFLLMRFFLKRQAGSIGVADLVVVVVIADAAQNGLAGDYGSITEGALLVATIAFWNFVVDWIDYRVPRLRRLIAGEPIPLIRDGKPIAANLRRERVTPQELASQIRLHGVEDPRDVAHAIIEPNGHISVIKGKPREEADDSESEQRPGS